MPFKLHSLELSLKKHLSLKFGVLTTKVTLISNFKDCFFQLVFYVAYWLEVSQDSWDSKLSQNYWGSSPHGRLRAGGKGLNLI